MSDDESDTEVFDKDALLGSHHDGTPDDTINADGDQICCHCFKVNRTFGLYALTLLVALTCGLSLSIVGPTLLAMQHSTKSREDQIVLLFSGRAVGGLAGTLLAQFLCQFISPRTVIATGFLFLSISNFIIPWCSQVWSLMPSFALQGFGLTLAMNSAFAIYSQHYNISILSRRLYYLILGVGCILAPVISLPYAHIGTNGLVPKNETGHDLARYALPSSLNVRVSHADQKDLKLHFINKRSLILNQINQTFTLNKTRISISNPNISLPNSTLSTTASSSLEQHNASSATTSFQFSNNTTNDSSSSILTTLTEKSPEPTVKSRKPSFSDSAKHLSDDVNDADGSKHGQKIKELHEKQRINNIQKVKPDKSKVNELVTTKSNTDATTQSFNLQNVTILRNTTHTLQQNTTDYYNNNVSSTQSSLESTSTIVEASITGSTTKTAATILTAKNQSSTFHRFLNSSTSIAKIQPTTTLPASDLHSTSTITALHEAHTSVSTNVTTLREAHTLTSATTAASHEPDTSTLVTAAADLQRNSSTTVADLQSTTTTSSTTQRSLIPDNVQNVTSIAADYLTQMTGLRSLYTIVGVVSLVSSLIAFCCVCCCPSYTFSSSPSLTETSNSSSVSNSIEHIIIRATLFITVVGISGLEVTYMGYLFTFGVRYLYLSAREAILLSSLHLLAVVVVRLLSIFGVRCIRPKFVTGICFILLIAGVTCTWVRQMVRYFWIAVVFIGAGFSLLIPGLLEWSNVSLSGANANCAAVTVLMAQLAGEMFVPVVTGYLQRMTSKSSALVYVTTVICAVSSVSFVLLIILARRRLNENGHRMDRRYEERDASQDSQFMLRQISPSKNGSRHNGSSHRLISDDE